ncbi:hypothetical protein CABS01_14844 [Colletotrichum abscissum]|uniref:uncharacterized protein n=1 Tax=Colletotrichum abscissum TaxID=1671311 RepID=UPI0027D536E9|nr:uncharacterized protein CABS01_14844 [Colletotrichum abscissum]KAK1478658.1 hypothetical protein CABS01_14844 [Colletotrichum abscissum]
MIPNSHNLVGTRITSCISIGRYWQPPSCLMIEHMIWRQETHARNKFHGKWGLQACRCWLWLRWGSTHPANKTESLASRWFTT